MKGKGKIGAATIIGIIILLLFLFNSPFGKKSTGFVSILYKQAAEQADNADRITDDLASNMEGEGKLAGEHNASGSNWSIPNILRHIVTGE